LRNALSNVCEADAIAAAGIDPTLRAEQVPVDAFVALANSLAHDAA
jgi:16S rRNA (adenine1518-N6/adenine1519-N6)-dimethyltransferase